MTDKNDCFLANEEIAKEREYERTGYSYRNGRGGRSYRGRSGRGRGAARGGFRQRHDVDYSEYAVDYSQVQSFNILYIHVFCYKIYNYNDAFIWESL